ncbi:hypothetical protein BaRGS_00014305 [Batillaria attramentaria]|uniref:Secreted protein n=1 Tax=Batillaria attramentaria TaxID=370345 RepID=A0ABD0L579_9CAEN
MYRRVFALFRVCCCHHRTVGSQHLHRSTDLVFCVVCVKKFQSSEPPRLSIIVKAHVHAVFLENPTHDSSASSSRRGEFEGLSHSVARDHSALVKLQLVGAQRALGCSKLQHVLLLPQLLPLSAKYSPPLHGTLTQVDRACIYMPGVVVAFTCARLCPPWDVSCLKPSQRRLRETPVKTRQLCFPVRLVPANEPASSTGTV